MRQPTIGYDSHAAPPRSPSPSHIPDQASAAHACRGGATSDSLPPLSRAQRTTGVDVNVRGGSLLGEPDSCVLARGDSRGTRQIMPQTDILGISAFYHDSAACLLRDGEILAAAQEERFTRQKGDASFPAHAVEYCLRAGGISTADLAFVGFYDKPLLKFERILDTYLGIAPRGFSSFLAAGPLWIKEKLYQERELREALGDYAGPLLYAEHHESHAASAFFPSPFEEAAILTIDGVGEWATASIGVGNGRDIKLLRELHWPDSLGLLYSAFTYYTGFKVNSGEYKVMGLAPYGTPKYVDLIYRELMDLREDGSFRLNQKYFNYLGGLTMTSPAFHRLFGGPPRVPESKLTQKEMDLAR